MAATYCTEAELRANLQLGTLYTSATVEEVCQASENIIKSYLWFNNYNIVAQESTTTTLATVYFDRVHDLLVGQTAVIENCGAKYNGSKTITAVTDYSISYTIVNGTVELKHPVVPYGTATATTHIDYATTPEVRLATLMVATEIWQAKQAANGGALDPNFQPSPFKMGSTLIAKVRGLLANHLAPNGLIG
jgi:hypothetical protein